MASAYATFHRHARPRLTRTTALTHAGAAILALAIPAAIAWFAVRGHVAGGGDMGQWLMLARVYEGEAIPAYRDPFAVPPAAPLLLIALEAIVASPFLAASLSLVVAFSLLGFAAFLLSRELFGLLPGLVAALLVAAGQPYFLWLMSFGTLPQLLATASFAATLAAIARWSRCRTVWRSALVAVGALAIVASHTPTAAVTLPLVALTFLLVPASPPETGRRHVRLAKRFARLWPLLPAGAIFLSQTLTRASVFEEYLANEAAFSRNGLAVAVNELLQMETYTVLLLAGLAILGALLLRSLVVVARDPPEEAQARIVATHRLRVAVVIGVPALCMSLAVVAFYHMRLGLDYVRIFALVGLPALVALTFLVPAGNGLDPGPWKRFAPRKRALVAVAIVALLLVPTLPAAVAKGRAAVAYYSLAAPQDLQGVVDEIEARVGPHETVWTTVREGKWVEGLSGRSALFGLPAWAIYRPWEWERKAAADTLASGVAHASTGLVSVLFQGPRAIGPSNPVVSVYYKGAFEPVLRLDDDQSRILLSDRRSIPLAALSFERVEAREEAGLAFIEVVHGATIDGLRIELARRVALEEGSPRIHIDLVAAAENATVEGCFCRFPCVSTDDR